MSNTPNYYPFDENSAVERVRLMAQHRLITDAMGGLFPEGFPLELQGENLADLGCASGSWVLEAAEQYPTCQIDGYDISQPMIQFAQTQAEGRQLDNVAFYVEDLRNFTPRRKYKHINIRILGAAIRKEDWPPLLAKCYQCLEPGGFLRWSDADFPMSSSYAYDYLFQLLGQMMHKRGQTFSTTGNNIGLLPNMIPLLLDAGFRIHSEVSYPLDASAHTDSQALGAQIAIAAMQEVQEILMRFHDPQEIKSLLEQVYKDVESERFTTLSLMLSVLAYKPL